MTAAEINAGLRVLRNYYADSKGAPHGMNDVQLSVYLDGLARFTATEFEAASRAWMRQSKWFPALSDLLELLVGPQVDLGTQAALAWAAVEAAVRRVGAYRGARFADPAIGECVRQVFGTWPRACGFDFDGPGWASRRQQFLAVFPTISRRCLDSSPTLGGLHRNVAPALIPHVEGLTAPGQLAAGETGPLSHKESKQALAAIAERIKSGPPKGAATEAIA